jgi:Trypsin-co-occurring domain 1
MAGRLVPMRIAGVQMLVETTPVAGTEPTAAKLAKAQDAVENAFDRAQEAIVAIAQSTVHTIDRLGQVAAHPDELEVSFGLKFSAQGHVFVAAAGGEASLEVTLTYRQPPESPAEAHEADRPPGDPAGSVQHDA